MRGSKADVKGVLGAAFSIVGSVVGAGFITGREILSFFFGQTPMSVFALLFVLFAAVFYSVFSAKNRDELRLLEYGDRAVCFLNLLSVASMLSATEGLASDLGIGCAFPVWSLLILGLAFLVCLRGMRGLAIFNAVLVPVMLAVVFFFSFAEIIKGGVNFGISSNGIVLPKCKPSSAIIYVGMNVFLTQPLLSGMRNNKLNGDRNFARAVALLSALLLSVTAALFLAVLPRESLLSDIPVLYISGGGTAARVAIAVTVLSGIVTTLVGSLYPLLNAEIVKSGDYANGKKYGFANKKRGRRASLCKVGVCLLAFLVSRLGFYTIVEKIYPIIGVLAVFYYVVVFVLLPVFRACKAVIKRGVKRRSTKRSLKTVR